MSLPGYKKVVIHARMQTHLGVGVAAGIIAVVAGLSNPLSAMAAVLDQNQELIGVSSQLSQSSIYAQTFTVGIEGNLSAIDVWIGKRLCSTEEITLEVVELDESGIPQGATLSTQVIPAESLTTVFPSYQMVNVLLGNPVPVEVGQQLGLVLSSPALDSCDYRAAGKATPAPYAAGFAYQYFGGTWNLLSSDLTFRTYVETNQAPTAVANIDPTGFANTDIELDGSESVDPDGDTLTYAWDFVGGPATPTIANADTVNAQFSADTPGHYQVSLTVTDTHGAEDTTTITVIVENQFPVAEAGPFLYGFLHQEFALEGSASDADGDVLTYSWELLNGGIVVFTDTDQLTARLTPTALDFTPREYLLRLTVTDIWGDSASDMTAIDIENRAPVANAGPDLEVAVGETIALDGSLSYDPDFHSLNYEWVYSSEQLDSTLTDERQPIAHFSAATPGVYELELGIFDPFGGEAYDAVFVTVTEPTQTPAEALHDLKNLVQTINASNGIINSLDGKLNAVQNAINDTNANNDGAALNALNAFISTTQNQAANGKISAEEATALIALANAIKALL